MGVKDTVHHISLATPPCSMQLMNERKRKMIAAKKQWDEEMEELKQTHESEVSQLKERLKKEKQSANDAASDQVSRVERDLEEQWRMKSERMVNQAEDKWRRKMDDLQESYQKLQAELSASNAKVRM